MLAKGIAGKGTAGVKAGRRVHLQCPGWQACAGPQQWPWHLWAPHSVPLTGIQFPLEGFPESLGLSHFLAGFLISWVREGKKTLYECNVGPHCSLADKITACSFSRNLELADEETEVLTVWAPRANPELANAAPLAHLAEAH